MKTTQVKKRLAINMLLSLAAIIIMLAAIEISSRIYIARFYGKAMFDAADRKTGKILNYFRPGSQVEVSGKSYMLNKDGFWDIDYPIEKKQGVKRVAVIGDSFTFGDGLDSPGDTYPKQLEAMLAGRGRYEVMNFGMPGSNAMDIYWIFRNKVIKYEPDLVIYGFFINDLEFLDYNSRPEYCINIGETKFHSYDFFRIKTDNLIKNFKGLGSKNSSIYFEDALNPGYYGFKCFMKIISSIDDAAKEHGGKLVIFYIPYNQKMDFEDKLNGAFSELGISSAHDVGRKFSGYQDSLNLSPEDIWLSKQNLHYTKTANSLLASILYDHLLSEGYV